MTQSMTNILENLKWRYATKVFDSQKKIDETLLKNILEGLRLSASSFGLQPWKFVVVRNEELRSQLLPSSWGQKQVVDASHLLVLCRIDTLDDKYIDQYLKMTADTRGVDVSTLSDFEAMLKGFLKNKTPEQMEAWTTCQVYIALGNLLTLCASLGVDACPMEGFKKNDYDRILGLKELGLRSVLVCPIGYRAESDKYATLEKIRNPFEKIVEFLD